MSHEVFGGRYEDLTRQSTRECADSDSVENSIEQTATDPYLTAISKPESVYKGVYRDIYLNLESDLESYLLFIESTNRQPWDRG